MTRHFRSTVAAAIGRGFPIVFIVGVLTVLCICDDLVAVGTQRLKAIHRALVVYEREHQEWPGHLSDLVPKYLPMPRPFAIPLIQGRATLAAPSAWRSQVPRQLFLRANRG